MRILVKILLTIVILIIALVSQALVSESGGTNVAGVRLIPGAILALGTIGVWIYKPKKQAKNMSDNKESGKSRLNHFIWSSIRIIIGMVIVLLLIRSCNG